MSRNKINKFVIPDGDQEEKIKTMLKNLELQSAASSFLKINEIVRRSNGTHLDFLENMLEKETISKEENRFARWVQQARFPFRKTILDFDFSFQPSIDQTLIRELQTCRFIKQGKNIVFLGPAGVGKTHLSIGLGLEAIKRGLETRFLKLDELIDLVEKADENSLVKLFRTLARPRLLILDDIDFYNTGKNASTFLFKLVLKRYEDKLSIIFTSNKSFREWGELFGNRQRVNAALDRIVERAEIINISGDSYRVKDKIKTSPTIMEKVH